MNKIFTNNLYLDIIHANKKQKKGSINMLKIARMTGTVYTHTQAYLENKIIRAYKVCFNSHKYKTDQLII